MKEFHTVEDLRRRLTLAESIRQAKREVLAMMNDLVLTSRGEERVTPDQITSFSDLHTYCDANMLGSLCDGRENVVFIDAEGEIGGAADAPESDGENDRWMAFGNHSQDEIDAWIKAGGHRQKHR